MASTEAKRKKKNKPEVWDDDGRDDLQDQQPQRRGPEGPEGGDRDGAEGSAGGDGEAVEGQVQGVRLLQEAEGWSGGERSVQGLHRCGGPDGPPRPAGGRCHRPDGQARQEHRLRRHRRQAVEGHAPLAEAQRERGEAVRQQAQGLRQARQAHGERAEGPADGQPHRRGPRAAHAGRLA